MKNKMIKWLLAVEAMVCVLLCLAQVSISPVFSSVFAFPFEQIGIGLRVLSLSGGVGNALAVLLYIAICLLPAITMFFIRKRCKYNLEDWLIVLLCSALFVVLYLMINPGVIPTLIGNAAGISAAKAVLGGTLYSVLCCYLVIRILRAFSKADMRNLGIYMIIMLNLLNFFFVYLVFVACFSDLLDSITVLRTGNIGNEHLLGASYVFLTLKFIVDALPYALNVFVVFAALKLLEEMHTDCYSAETVAAAERMSRLCAAVLIATMVSNASFNLLQLLFAKSLMVINGSVQIPVLSILFVLSALLITRFAAENKQLKDENDQFI